ncbi:MAG: SGNH hydrolase domain-containing protein, partial [Planctomycetaceae bacterium]
MASIALLGVSAVALGRSGGGNVLSGRAAVMAAARDSFRFVQEVDARAVDSGQVPRSGCVQDCLGSIAIWGDSHAMALLPAVESFAVRSGRSCWQLTHSQTAPAVSIWKP